MSKETITKYDPTLVELNFIKAIAEVRQHGIDKYGNRDDWHTTHPNEHYKAAMRHLYKAINGQELDSSGFPNVVMAVTNLMFEISRGNYTFNKEFEIEKERDKHSGQARLNIGHIS